MGYRRAAGLAPLLPLMYGLLVRCAFGASAALAAAHQASSEAPHPAAAVAGCAAQTEAEIELLEAAEAEAVEVRLLQSRVSTRGLDAEPATDNAADGSVDAGDDAIALFQTSLSGAVAESSAQQQEQWPQILGAAAVAGVGAAGGTAIGHYISQRHQAPPAPTPAPPPGATSVLHPGGAAVGDLCFENADCCPFLDQVDSLCHLFCREGKDIDKTDVRGWRLVGACAKKWNGWCSEDEDCGAGFYCERTSDSIAGTCTRDSLCDNSTCGRGRCRAGACTCDYGVTGTHCDRSTDAFAFLFYGNSPENLVSTRVLIKSMRAAGSQEDIVAIIPKNMMNITPADHLEILEGDGVKLYYTDPIFMPESMDKDPIIHSRWSGVMNKFAVWRLTNYSQVALLDTDMVFSFDTESPGVIFSECNAHLCAVRDGDSRYMNAGVMVVTPSTQRLAHILHVLSNEQHHFAMPEQSFLTTYCKNPSNKMKLQFLDKKWNSCVGGGMLHNIGWESTGYNVLHSCSWQGKPPNMAMCFPGYCSTEEQWHTVLTWQFYHMQVDACIMKANQEQCSGVGINQCTWCEHYCSNSKIACTPKLFNQSKARDTDEPDWKRADELNFLHETSGSEWPKKKTSAPWDRLPRGSWAWPQVAMYQILIDRFATPTPVWCEKLDDYCGGNLAGIREKLEYLEALGVDGVVLSPVVEQMPHGYHGYWTKDLYSVNPQYGNETELRELVVLLHERKMKAIIDINLNHAGGPKMNASDPKDVSILKPFDKVEDYHSDNCSLIHNEDYDRGAHFLERCKLYGLPDYNHENPRVWQRLQKFVREHVDTYGFDGIRVDAARHISRSFLDHIPESGPPIPAFFEVVNGQLSYIAAYADGDYNAIYNYPLYYQLVNIFVPGPMQAPMSALGDWMEQEVPKASGRLLLNFLENNDLPRFIYKLDGDLYLYHNALLCIMGMEGLPVLLYGSEQNARGILNFSDPLKVDNWRPALWHYGYNTSHPTFQMIKKVLWVRQRLNGMHDMRQQPIFSDHRVLVFTRGPVIFAVTNTGYKHAAKAQRVIWDNATNADGTLGAYDKATWVCNLLSMSPLEECGIVSPGNISRLHINGEPKMFVPYTFAKEFLEDQRKEAAAHAEQAAFAASTDAKVVSLKDWHTIPNPPEVHIQALARTPRSRRPADVVMADNPSHVWHPFPKLPPHIDTWSPPVGMPPTHLVSASLQDACFYLGAGEKDGALFVRRDNVTYVLCPDSPQWCPDTIGNNVDLGRMQSLVAHTAVSADSLPVVHLTYDIWYGVYHLVVGALPSIAPYLSQLQSGTMRVFLHTGQKMVTPILSMLGVTSAAFFPPSDPPLQQPFSFCTSRMHFDMSTRPLYPRVEYVPHLLAGFRHAMHAASGPRPCGARKFGIVILSRGNGSRSITNEPELAKGLESLGRPVHVVDPGPYAFFEMIDALGHAEVVVGGHGANLANMIFAPEGVKVVEVVPQVPFDLQDYHFRDLAGALNLTYVPVGQQVRPDEYDKLLASDPMTMDKAVYSYTVDVEKVVAVVGSLL